MVSSNTDSTFPEPCSHTLPRWSLYNPGKEGWQGCHTNMYQPHFGHHTTQLPCNFMRSQAAFHQYDRHTWEHQFHPQSPHSTCWLKPLCRNAPINAPNGKLTGSLTASQSPRQVVLLVKGLQSHRVESLDITLSTSVIKTQRPLCQATASSPLPRLATLTPPNVKGFLFKHVTPLS